jgi:DNA-binding PadR family transcriptional regulator
MAKKGGLPLLSEKEALILRLLAESGGEGFGLGLVEQSGNKLGRGTVYVTLDRMEDKNYVKSRRESIAQSDSQAIPRRIYRITGLGQQVLATAEMWAAQLQGVRS